MIPHPLVRILLELLKDALGLALGKIGQVPDRLRTLVVVLGFEGLAGESLELSIKGLVISQGSQAAQQQRRPNSRASSAVGRDRL